MDEKVKYDCVVLDLDGTLVYSSDNKIRDSECIMFEDMHGDMIKMWVCKRPGFNEFLDECFKHGNVGVWSMGQSGYVNAVVSLFPQKPIFVYNWCHCDRDSRRINGIIFKRLKNIPCDGRIIMIDDKKDALETCGRIETYIVPEWDPKINDDTVLYELSNILFN